LTKPSKDFDAFCWALSSLSDLGLSVAVSSLKNWAISWSYLVKTAMIGILATATISHQSDNEGYARTFLGQLQQQLVTRV
jgi:hypothetical protein